MIFSDPEVSREQSRIRVGGAVIPHASWVSNVRRLAAGLERRLPSATAVGLYVDPSPEFCFALFALALAGKTCVPFDFIRHHDNVADIVRSELPILLPSTPRLRWEHSPIYSVDELLRDAGDVGRFESVASVGANRAPLFVTRLGLVRLEFGRGYLRRFFRSMDDWRRVGRMSCALAPLDFIGILEIFWVLERGGEIVLRPGSAASSATELLDHLRHETIDCVQCDALQAVLIQRGYPRMACLVQSGNEDVESERFRRLMHTTY